MNQKQKQKLLDFAQSTAANLEQFGNTLQGALEHAPEKIEQIRDTVGPAIEKLHSTFQYVEGKAGETREGALRLAGDAQRKHQAVKKVLFQDETPAQDNHDSNKFVWLLIGFGAGVLLGLFLAPSSGRRSRARVRDQFNKKRHSLTRATSNHATDIGNKARGLTHKIQQVIYQNNNDEEVTNEILADRVRTALGQDPETRLPHLNIECCDGVVTLYGPTVTTMQETAVINAVQNVPGVLDVHSKLPISNAI